MAELAEKLLVVVADRDQVGTLELSKEWGVDHQKLVGAVKSLQCGDVVEAEMRTDKVWDLTEEGKVAVLLGSPESRVLCTSGDDLMFACKKVRYYSDKLL